MTIHKGASARGATSRASSVARTIAKRRDKPYKTEQSRILAKKRKLTLNTSYTTAPPGFTFLPVGTPDLADRCKEISRQKGFTVHVVNATPISKAALDAEKVSHHIHRVGYHFRAEVVESACQELGYVLARQGFVKESQLEEQREQSKMARALAKFGLHFDVEKETDLQVRAAVKELFPRMPEMDLTQVLRHAWEKGADRVGTNMEMDLPRRVQLAVLARIRHTYTDYDRLLRAFEWKDARALVEPVCLKKLIEWRGEVDDGNDDELEEIVRETIVIDDDDDDILSEADDEGSTELDDGNVSDTSIEISHNPVALEDIGAESHDESSRRFLQKYRPPPQAAHSQRRLEDVNQKIDATRQQLRNGPVAATQRDVVRVTVPPGDGSVVIGGRLYQRQPAQQQPENHREQNHAYRHAPRPMPQSAPYVYQTASRPQSRASSSLQHPERVVSSIEQNDKHPARGSGPLFHSPAQAPQAYHAIERGAAANVVDLTSPGKGQVVRQPAWPTDERRSGFVNASVAPIQYVPLPQQNGKHYDGQFQSRAAAFQAQNLPAAHGNFQPQQIIYVHAPHSAPQPVHGAPAAVQQLPRAGVPPRQTLPLDARPVIPGAHHHSAVAGHAPLFYYPR